MLFYKYIYYRIYSFFESLKSTNPYYSATGIISLLPGILVLKIVSFAMKKIYHLKMTYEEIAIPCLLVFFAVFAVNYFLLQHDLKYIETEKIFKSKQQPASFTLWSVIVVLVMLAVLILVPAG